MVLSDDNNMIKMSYIKKVYEIRNYHISVNVLISGYGVSC